MSSKAYVYSHNGIRTRLVFPDAGIVRVTRTLRDHFLSDQSPVVEPLEALDIQAVSTETETALTAGGVRVVIRDGVLTFTDENGVAILREPIKRPCALQEKPVMINQYDLSAPVREEKSVDGVRAYAVPAETVQDRTAYEARQQFVFDPDEGLYGLGSHEEGIGNLRGHSRVLYQHNMKAVVPVLVSTKGWGILFDMGCMMAFHDDEEGSYLWADCADELDWYFFYGEGDYASAMKKYRLLTGETPMLPKYALGYIQSKERYVDAEEMVNVAAEYRRRKIPLDMIVLDWQSWPEGQWGWKHFDESRFPDPDAFTVRLHEMGVRLMISIWPSMQGDRNLDRKAMLEQGFMLGNRLIYDAFRPEARALYWQQARDGLFRHGIDAWWCDCSEPFESDWHGGIKPEPALRAAMNMEEARRYLDPAKIGLYSLHHSRGIWEGQRSETDEKRVCNLTRSSWAGQHRYATVTWSGDVSATWETLRRHVPEGLNFCAAGEAFWSTDIGAFFPGRWKAWFIDGDYNAGMEDLGYRELYVRWAQYAAFLPMMRSHGTGTPREIWRLGEAGEPFYDAMAETIRLRYHLAPYLYSLMALLRAEGIPMLRVPALVFPQDKRLREVNDQMMLGDALLVKPVTRPMYYLPGSQTIENRDDSEHVYLPEGCGWYDLYGGQYYPGGQTVAVTAPLDHIPVFVRAGAILTWGGEAQSTAELKDLPLEIWVYPGRNGCLRLYDDASDGYGYEHGESSAADFTWNDEKRLLTIGARRGTYPGMSHEQTFLISAADRQTVKTIIYRGESIEITL